MTTFVSIFVHLYRIVSQLCLNVSMQILLPEVNILQNLAVVTLARSQGISKMDQA